MTNSTNAERNQIKKLHGLGDSLKKRDVAEFPTQKTWSNAPTRIVPSSVPPTSNNLQNPFNTLSSYADRGKPGNSSNRTGAGRSSNQTARQTITSVALRQRTLGETRNVVAKAASGSRVALPPNPIEVIDLDPPSTDDLNLAETTNPFPISKQRTTSTQAVPTEHRSVKRPRLAEDGDDTKWAAGRFSDDELDPIEQYSSSEHTNGIHVKARIALYDAMAHPSEAKRRIDLVEVKKGTSLKGGMKPKVSVRPLPIGRPSALDPAATPSTNFASGTKRKRNEGDFSESLPVRSLCIGLRMKEEAGQTVSLKREDNGGKIYIQGDRSVNTIEPLDVRSMCNKIIFTKSSGQYEDIVIQLETCASTRRYPHSLGKDFKLGDPYCGTISLLFDTSHPLWAPEKYDTFVAWLAELIDQKETVNESGAKAAWEGTKNHAAFKTHSDTQERARGPSSAKGTQHLQPPSRSKSTSRSADIATLSERSSSIPSALNGSTHNASRSGKSNERSVSAGLQAQSTNPGTYNLRRSSRHSAPAKTAFDLDADEVILIYPQGIPGAVNITHGDVSRLEPGEFLNDTLIEFGLKLWLRELEEQDPELAKQIHVFSSFFYKKLNKKNIEEGYNSVRKWTSKFDLFQKKYIIVPINEHMHWYLAIIYEPEHVLKPAAPVSPTSPVTRLQSRNANRNDDISEAASSTRESSFHPDVVNVPTSSEVEIEKDLNDFTTACSISTHASSPTEDSVPMDVDPMAIADERPSSALSYVDALMDTDTRSAVSIGPEIASNQDEHHYSAITTAPNGISRSPSEVDADSLNITEDITDNLVPGSTAIEPSKFYSIPSSKGKGKEKATSVPIIPSPLELEDEEDEIEIDFMSTIQRTCIFTLDSLGGGHTQAIRQLTRYLKLEAKDKKGIESNVKIDGRQASVPTQPNFCDCGVYLLHLAQTFLSRPRFYYEKSFATKKTVSNHLRQVVWHDEKVAGMRLYLTSRIHELSDEWRKNRQEKGKTKTGTEGEVDDAGTNVATLSDSDIDIVEPLSPPAKQKPKPKPPSKVRAARLR